MTPEYIESLAELADPEQLWRISGFDQLDLPEDKRRQLDTAVALRRHASHIRDLNALQGTGKSMVLTRLSINGTAVATIPTPAVHRRLLRKPLA